MPSWLGPALLGAGGLAALAWLAVLLDPARAWRLLPVGEDVEPDAAPTAWPTVCVIVPAHDEESVLPLTLPCLLEQDYPGEWHVVLVDERSSDRTRALALELRATHQNGDRLQVVTGLPLPAGWMGKVWGLEQGYSASKRRRPGYYLLTDTDVAHATNSLRTLVSESEAAGLALNSRMARLYCESPAERLLIPAFVLFFNLLYPMRRVNDPASSVVAAAGGCALVRAEELEAIESFEQIRGEVIDDVNLARAIAPVSPHMRLSVSRTDVRSIRRYSTVGPIWRMVRRTAFDELNYSWLRLSSTLATMMLLFVLPVASLALTVALALGAASGALDVDAWLPGALGGVSLSTLVLMRVAYGPACTLFDAGRGWAWALPLAGTIYGLVTLDSARQHLRGRSGTW